MLPFYRTGPPGRGAPAGSVGPSGFQTFTILSVLDAKTGEDLSVVEAVRRGILDETKRNYKDTLTGETMLLDTAVKRSESAPTPHPSLSCYRLVLIILFMLVLDYHWYS